jgi:RNA polymerase sigma factor (sigma-70 family)
MVWGVCQRLLAHRQDAEDALQATFLVLACKAASIRRREQLASWLFGVARRAALNLRAKRTRRRRQEQLRADPPDVPRNCETLWDDFRAVLDEELARMPDKYRLPLLLCGLEGMTYTEAALYLGWPTGTVAGRLSRARELLRARLCRRGVTIPAAALTAMLVADVATAQAPPRIVVPLRSGASWSTAGKPAAAAVSPTAAALKRGVLMKMSFVRLLRAATLMVAVTVTLGGAGLVWHLTGTPMTRRTTPIVVTRRPFPHPVVPPPVLPEAVPTRGPHPGKPAIRLPTDPGAVALRMERAVDASGEPGLTLTIYADGRVVAEVPGGVGSASGADLTKHAQDRITRKDPRGEPGRSKMNVLEGRLSAPEVEGLLRFALHEQEFFDFDPAAVTAEIHDRYQSDGRVEDHNDSTTTGFRIQTADRDHQVRWYRLDKTAWDFPKVERLLQLYALERRLSHVYYVLVTGGQARVDAAVEKANELAMPFYHLYPDAPLLTAADLRWAAPMPDGSGMQFAFSRPKDKRVASILFEVLIEVPERGEAKLRYAVPPQ